MPTNRRQTSQGGSATLLQDMFEDDDGFIDVDANCASFLPLFTR